VWRFWGKRKDVWMGMMLGAQSWVFPSHEAMFGDGDAMGVAGQVVENMFGTPEGWLGVDDSVLVGDLAEEAVEWGG